MDGIFPDKQEFDKMLDSLPSYPSHVSLAAVDPLVLPGDWDEEQEEVQPELDIFGYSAYARVVSSLLLCYVDNRDSARQNIWALRHFLALALYAKDALDVPSVTSPAFGKNVSKSDLEDIISRADQIAAYLLTHSVDDGWFARSLPRLISGKVDANADGVERLLEGLVNPRSGDSSRESRILHSILKHMLPGVSKSEADQFIMLGRTVEKKGSLAHFVTSIALIDPLCAQLPVQRLL